jgi:hypothetical protein
MPEWLHKQLAQAAAKKGLKGERKNAYIYGTLQKYEEAHGRKKARKSALKKVLGG